MKIAKTEKGGVLSIRLSGSIDEDFTLSEKDFGSSKNIALDVGGIDLINSCGCREWIKLMKTVKPGVSLSFANCPKIFIDQVNLLKDFIPPSGAIESFNVPYFCESCSKITLQKYSVSQLANGPKDVSENMTCSHCGKQSELDVIPNTFFRFLPKK